MGGPSSAKAGQNGQSDSTDGKNVIYDEMLEELCDADGTDRIEYWKQIVCPNTLFALLLLLFSSNLTLRFSGFKTRVHIQQNYIREKSRRNGDPQDCEIEDPTQ